MRFGVEFGTSSSRIYAHALGLARQAPVFEMTGDRASAVYDSLTEFLPLARCVRGWKSARIIIDGREIALLEYMNLLRVAECYDRKSQFINKDLYCRVGLDAQRLIFPCKALSITEGGLRTGKFGQDKDLIKFALEQDARQSMACCCPEFDLHGLLGAVDDLPDTWDSDIPLGLLVDPLENLLRDVDFGQ